MAENVWRDAASAVDAVLNPTAPQASIPWLQPSTQEERVAELAYTFGGVVSSLRNLEPDKPYIITDGVDVQLEEDLADIPLAVAEKDPPFFVVINKSHAIWGKDGR